MTILHLGPAIGRRSGVADGPPGSRLGHLLVLGLVLVCLASLTSCSQAPDAPAEEVRLRITTGSTTENVLRDLSSSYESAHARVTLDLHEGDSAAAQVLLRSGRSDISAVSWHPKDAPPPDGTQAVPFARDAIAIVVHPSNALRNLTLLQLKAIYQGETLDWQALGGLALETVVVSREEGSGTRAAFEALAMGDQRVTLSAIVMPSGQAVVDYVASHPAAVGYVSAGQITDKVRAVPVEGLLPNSSNIRSGAYHLARLLYLFVPTDASPAIQSFVDFVLSPSGQAIVAKRHVPLL